MGINRSFWAVVIIMLISVHGFAAETARVDAFSSLRILSANSVVYGSVEPMTVRFAKPLVSKDPINRTYDWLDIEGCDSRISQSGHPALPVKTVTFKLNLGLTVTNVDVTVVNASFEGVYRICPSLKPVVGESGGGLTTPDPAIYGSDRLYPGKWSKYVIRIGIDPDSDQRVQYVAVTLYPVQYAPASGIVTICKEATVRVQYEGVARAYAASTYNLLIITSPMLQQSASDLASYRMSMGIATVTRTTDWIYANYLGVDNPEKIRNFVIWAKNTWGIQYLLIFGDADQVPVRQAYIADGSEEDRLVATDLYYVDLQYSWNDNGDGRWGEIPYDQVEGVPDLYLGRLPASTSTEASNLVNKIKQYEQNADPSSPWFQRFLLLGTDSAKEYAGAEGEILKNYIANYYLPAGFSTTKLYETQGTLTVSNAVAQINNGYGFVNFAGHGNPDLWSFEGAGNYASAEASGQTNGVKLPIVCTMACSTSRFHDTDCIGERFLLNPNGGAIAYFGATSFALFYVGSAVTDGLAGEMDKRFFQAYFDGYSKLGRIWSRAVSQYVAVNGLQDKGDWRTVAEYSSPFGDPLLITGGGSRVRTHRIYSSPMSYLGQDPESVKSNDIGAWIRVDYVYQEQSRSTTSKTYFDVTADVGSTINFTVTSTPSGWSFANKWDRYGYIQYDAATLKIRVRSGSGIEKIAAFFSSSFPPLTVTSITPSDGAVATSSPVELKVRVTSSGSAIQEATVKFYVDSSYVGSRNSDVNGYASYNYNPPSVKSYSWYATAEKYLYSQGASPTWTFTYTPFDFSLSNSGGITVTQGSSAYNTITVTLNSGTGQTVALSASGIPLGASASFNPVSGNPTFTSICTISTLSSTPTGTHTITVIGTSGGLTRTTMFTLTIKQAGTLQHFDLDYRGTPPSSDGNDQQSISVGAGSTLTLFFYYREGDAGNYYIVRVFPEWNKGLIIAKSDNHGAVIENTGREIGGFRWDYGVYTVPSTPGTYRVRVVYRASQTPPTWDSYDRLLAEGTTIVLPIVTTRTTASTTTSTTMTSYTTTNAASLQQSTTTTTSFSSSTSHLTTTSTRYSGLISTTYTTRNTLYSTLTSFSTTALTSSGTSTLTTTELSATRTVTVTQTQTSTITSENTVYVKIIVLRTSVQQFLEKIMSTILQWSNGLTRIIQNLLVTETAKETVVRVEPLSKERGTCRIELGASPRPGYVNKPVVISGTMYGSWRCIRDGMVVSKPIEITTGWGFSTVVTADYYGRFSATTNCPSTGGTYQITATFREDEDLTGASTTIQYEVVSKIPTVITVQIISVFQGYGVPPVYGVAGYLKTKEGGLPVAGKTIYVTVRTAMGGTYSYECLTDAKGYYKPDIGGFTDRPRSAAAEFRGDADYEPSTASTGSFAAQDASVQAPAATATITEKGSTQIVLNAPTPGEKGSTRIALDASPKPGYVNKPVTISGTLYGSWRCIRDGMVVGKPVEITTSWGFRAVVTTNDRGEFSIDTTAPATVYSPPTYYPITATFYEDQDLTGTSTTIQYEVVAKIATTVTVQITTVFQGYGVPPMYSVAGYLRTKEGGLPIAGKTIYVTVRTAMGATYSYECLTDANGYYKLPIGGFTDRPTSATAEFKGDADYEPSQAYV